MSTIKNLNTLEVNSFFSALEKSDTLSTTSTVSAVSSPSLTGFTLTYTDTKDTTYVPTIQDYSSDPDYVNVITDKTFNLITGFNEKNDTPNPGLFKINLEAKVERSNNTVACNYVQESRQKFYTEDSFEPHLSNYWFINKQDWLTGDNKNLDLTHLNLDTDLCQADDQYRTYPNILPGYLYISPTPELPTDIEFLKNSTTGINSPSIYIIYDNNYE